MNPRTLLPYMDDEKFLDIVQKIMVSGMQAMQNADKTFTKNVIDPFSMLFEMRSFGLDADAWMRKEKARQSQKTLSNKVGNFHQEIIGALDGWNDLGKQEILDVVCREKRVIAEIKNKFNTVKVSEQIGLYHSMTKMVQHKTQKYFGYTALYL